MIKNQANIYQFVLRDMIGQGVTGLSPTVQIRKDSGTFAVATNAVSEVGDGLYELTLTATECNCNIMAIKVSLPDGQFPAILTNEYLTTTGGATPAEIWGYSGDRLVTNTIPTAAQITSAVWDAGTRTLTASPTDISGLATAAALSGVADNVTAIKAKTDTIPQNPAAIGDAMTLTSAYDAAKTASQFDPANTAVTIDSASVQAVQSGLSTFDPATDAVTIATAQASTLATAAVQAAQTEALDTLAASILHWTATASALTLYDNNGAAIGVYDLTRDSSGNITAIEPHVEG